MCRTSGQVVRIAKAIPPRITHTSSALLISGEEAQRAGDLSTPAVEGLSMSVLAIGRLEHT